MAEKTTMRVDPTMLRVLQEFVPKMPVTTTIEKEECFCGHKKPVTQFIILNSGVFKFLSDVCQDCPNAKREAKKLALIVCGNCHKIVDWRKPNIDLVGFEFKAGHIYHTNGCAACVPKDKFGTPKITSVQIIEKLIYDKKYFNPRKPLDPRIDVKKVAESNEA